MKILFIANRAEFGGAPKCMLELIEQLIQQYGVEVEVVTSGENVIAQWCDEHNLKHYAVGHTSFAIGKGSTPIRRVAKTILTPYYFVRSSILNHKALKKACSLIDLGSVDIIHTNSNRDCLGAMLAQKYNKTHVWHLREFGKEDYDIRYLKRNYIRYMNSTTNYFIAISDAVKNAWVQKGISEEKLYRIYDGIALPNKKTVEMAMINRKKSKREILRFAYLGIVCPSKGQFDAVRALSYLDSKVAKNIKIDFWGDCTCLPEFTNQIKDFAKDNGLAESISFMGFTDNIWNELPKYDAAMVCSRSEAFGRITPEYMSLGLQVIASDTGANPELIEDGVSGYIYKHDDLKSLADKINGIYCMDYEERERVAEQAIKRASLFSNSNNAVNINKLYCEIMRQDGEI